MHTALFRHPIARRLGLALSGAALLTSAAPPCDLWPLALFAWAPLVLLAAEGRVRQAALFGWLQGIVGQGLVLASVPSALHRVGGAPQALSFALYVLLIVCEGARCGVVAALTARAFRNGWPLLLAFPAVLVGAEFLYPMFFPWGSWLFVQGCPILLQLAEVGGPLTVSLWIGVVNAGFASAWLARNEGSRLAAPAVSGLTLMAVIVFGDLRMRAVDARAREAPSVRVAVLQGNVAPDSAAASDPVGFYRERTLELLSNERADLLITPETAIDIPVREEDLGRTLATQYFHPAGGPSIRVPLLTGIVLERSVGLLSDRLRIRDPNAGSSDAPVHRFNSAALVDPDGTVRGTYDKRDLVLLGETLPGADMVPWLRRLMPTAGNFTAGSASALVPFGARQILVSICYEDILPEATQQALEQADPDLLVNLTSDSWFGTSRVPLLHFALAKLRAVEHRRFLVRTTNTGVTAVVDPAGRTVAKLEPYRTASMIAAVRWMRGRTPYEAMGSSWGYLAAGTSLLTFLLRRSALPLT